MKRVTADPLAADSLRPHVTPLNAAKLDKLSNQWIFSLAAAPFVGGGLWWDCGDGADGRLED